jgi:hypothetical protein
MEVAMTDLKTPLVDHNDGQPLKNEPRFDHSNHTIGRPEMPSAVLDPVEAQDRSDQIEELLLPSGVALSAKHQLSDDQRALLLEAARTPYRTLREQINSLQSVVGDIVANETAKVRRSSISPSNKRDIYDEFFAVARIEEDADAVALRALLQTMSGYVKLMVGTSITELEQAQLIEAVQAIVENVEEFGMTRHSDKVIQSKQGERPPLHTSAAIRARYHCSALLTWIVGHRGMFVFLRELTRCLMLLEYAASRGDKTDALRQFARMIAITHACSIAFKFTGDMTSAEYDSNVVPAMQNVHQRFSGSWSRDHAAMMAQLGRTFAVIDGFEAEMAQAHLVTYFMVKQHERVCELKAKGRPSLNAMSSGMANAEEGYKQLRDIFGPMHLKLICKRPQYVKGPW